MSSASNFSVISGMIFVISVFVDAAKKLLGVAWDCVQFWTPISSTIAILWLLYRPDRFHPSVDSAVLVALNSKAPANATCQPSIRYDLAFDLGLSNSHRHLSIRYLDIGATAFYNGSTKLGSTNDGLPTPFR